MLGSRCRRAQLARRGREFLTRLILEPGHPGWRWTVVAVRMEACSLKYITTACAGEQMNGLPETRVQRVCTDSRQVKAGDLFFALQGDRFDGHDFLRTAAEQGAGAVVVERGRVPANWNG